MDLKQLEDGRWVCDITELGIRQFGYFPGSAVRLALSKVKTNIETYQLKANEILKPYGYADVTKSYKWDGA